MIEHRSIPNHQDFARLTHQPGVIERGTCADSGKKLAKFIKTYKSGILYTTITNSVEKNAFKIFGTDVGLKLGRCKHAGFFYILVKNDATHAVAPTVSHQPSTSLPHNNDTTTICSLFINKMIELDTNKFFTQHNREISFEGLKPINLCTIQKRISTYTKSSAFFDDVLCCFDNAIKFYGAKDAIHKEAERLRQIFIKLNASFTNKRERWPSARYKELFDDAFDTLKNVKPVVHPSPQKTVGLPRRNAHNSKTNIAPIQVPAREPFHAGQPSPRGAITPIVSPCQVISPRVRQEKPTPTHRPTQPFPEPPIEQAVAEPNLNTKITKLVQEIFEKAGYGMRLDNTMYARHMDFNTMLTKAKRNEYTTIDEFDEDLRLMFKNIITWDPENCNDMQKRIVNAKIFGLVEVLKLRQVGTHVQTQSKRSSLGKRPREVITNEASCDEDAIIEAMEAKIRSLTEDVQLIKRQRTNSLDSVEYI